MDYFLCFFLTSGLEEFHGGFHGDRHFVGVQIFQQEDESGILDVFDSDRTRSTQQIFNINEKKKRKRNNTTTTSPNPNPTTGTSTHLDSMYSPVSIL
jgi:hypothetical protein